MKVDAGAVAVAGAGAGASAVAGAAAGAGAGDPPHATPATSASAAFPSPSSFICLFANSAAPIAPISPGYGARTTSLPTYCSKAARTASFWNVPPCTTIFRPSASVFETRTTLVKTFSMIERHRPAMMSSGVLPFFCSVTTLEFMNTVQRLPSTAGFCARNAAEAISRTSIPNDFAKLPKNDPHPDEHASLTRMSVTTPSSTQMAFMSCPPISRMNDTSGAYFAAATSCATVSTICTSAWNARPNRASP